MEDNLGALADERDEVVLVETAREDGSSATIIYRNGGVVDAVALESLCTKV